MPRKSKRKTQEREVFDCAACGAHHDSMTFRRMPGGLWLGWCEDAGKVVYIKESAE